MNKAVIILFVIVTFLLTGYSLVRQETESASNNSMLVIMYDDAAVEDYEIAFPVHRAFEVPGVVCANSSTLGTDNNLSVKQLKEMEDAGWEVVNHGKFHAGLDDKRVFKKVNSGDNVIHVKWPYRIKNNYNYLLFNKITGQKEIVEIDDVYVGDKNKKNGYVTLRNKVQNSYPYAETYLRLTKESAFEEVVGGKQELVNLGFNVTNYTYSYNAYEEWSKELVALNHNASRSNSGSKLLLQRVNRKPFNKYALYSTNLEVHKITEKQIDALLTKTARKNGVTILWAHTWSDNFTAERLTYIIQSAKDRNIRVVTLQEALDYSS